MVSFCHRCGGELAHTAGESSFCPHCGAPQLRVMEENVATIQDGEALPGGAATASTPGGQVIWSTVVAYAAAIAVVAGTLAFAVLWLPAVFPLVWLLAMGGAVLVLGLYQRKYPANQVTPRMGAKIGVVYGLIASLALVTAVAAMGLVARFGMHTMGTVDSLLSNAMHQAAEQQSAQAGGVAMSAEQLNTFYSPEVRAGLALFLMTCGVVLVTLVSTLGGALGGFIRMRRR